MATIQPRGLLVDSRRLLVGFCFATIEPRVLGAASSGLAICLLMGYAAVPARADRSVLRSSRKLRERRQVIRAFKHAAIVNIRLLDCNRGFYDRRSCPTTPLPELAGRFCLSLG